MTEQELIQKIYEQAQDLGACDLFKGNEGIAELMRLFLTPQGVEFCMKNHFPSLRTMRMFKQYDVEQYNIYVDAGEVVIYDPEYVALVGRTTAKIYVTTNKPLHHVFLYRGAGAVIDAEGWSVTKVKAERGCKSIANVRDNAIVIQ